MRLLVTILAAVLAFTQASHAQQNMPPPLFGVPLQGFPTLAPLVKKVAPGVPSGDASRSSGTRCSTTRSFADSSTFPTCQPNANSAPPVRA